jgi:2-C-methyl-D-erythritol 4-phosphate cytidylyltransferase
LHLWLLGMMRGMRERNIAIILAAGKGSRMGGIREKTLLPLLGKPLLAWTLSVFEACEQIHGVILVVPPGREQEFTKEILVPYSFSKVLPVSGGLQRQDSIQNGFAAIQDPCHVVIIHDGARPLVTREVVIRAVSAAREYGASVVAVPVKETIKVANEEGMVRETPDRAKLWSAQTPQAYRYEIIAQALAQARKENFYGTDDASLVERTGRSVRIVPGSYQNIKVTTPEDFLMAEAILRTSGEKHALITEG